MDSESVLASGSKRSTTPPPQQVKRAKTEESDTKYPSDSTRSISLVLANGVERIPIPANVNVMRLSSEDLQELIRERVQLLIEQGKRVVGLPVVLNDGIVIHWVRGNSDSVDSPHRQTPINSQGFVWSQKADTATNLPRRILRYSDQNSEKPPPADLAINTSGGSGTSAGNAIIIDSDEERSHQEVGPGEALTDLDPSFQNQEPADLSGSDIEFISWIRPADKVEGCVESASGSSREIPPDLPPNNESIAGLPESSLRRPQLSRAEIAAALFSEQDDTLMMSHDSEDNSSPRMTREEVAAALFGGRSIVDPKDAQDTGPDSEEDDTAADGFNDVGPSLQRIRPPSPPSLEPIRKLLTRARQLGGHSRDSAVIPRETLRRPQRGGTSPQEAESTESGESSEEDVDHMDHGPSEAPYKRVPLPKTVHGRARRLLRPDSSDLPLVAITMRGDCHFLHRKQKYRITGYSLPNPGVFRHVEDCCMVGDTAVLGYDKGSHQISFISFSCTEQGRPQMVDVARSPHNSGLRYRDAEKRGVKCLAAMHAEGGRIKFFSAGHDGTIHKWMASVGSPDEPHSKRVASLGACLTALAYCDRDTSVVSSAQKKLHVTDLNRSKTITHLLSNDIHQIHVHPQAAYVTLLEVRHLDRQIQLFDSRKGNFDSEPCLTFGHRKLDGKFSATHTRGSVHQIHFARGSEDGCVLLWDFRNSKEAVVESRYQRAENVVHTIFAERDIAAFGQGVVTFFEDYLAQ